MRPNPDLVAPPEAFFLETDSPATLEVTGADRQSWLNGLVTCNLAPLKAGQGIYGLATSKVGKILADLLIFVGSDRLLVACQPSRLEVLRQSFEGYLIMEDVELRDASAEWAWLLAHGARAGEVAREVGAGAGGHGFAAPFSGLGDGVMVVPAAERARALAALGERARRVTGSDWEWMRISHGLPRFGVDFDEKTYPQEASLERRAVSFSKGCYLGQEVICRLEMRGHVHRRLAVLEIDTERADEILPGAAVTTAAGDAIGAVTSAGWSPRARKAVALAMVKYAHSEPGAALRVGGHEAAVVAPATGGQP